MLGGRELGVASAVEVVDDLGRVAVCAKMVMMVAVRRGNIEWVDPARPWWLVGVAGVRSRRHLVKDLRHGPACSWVLGLAPPLAIDG